MRRFSAISNLIFPLYQDRIDTKSLSSSDSSICTPSSISCCSSTSSSEYDEHLALFHKFDYLYKSPIAGLNNANHEESLHLSDSSGTFLICRI